MKFNGIRNIPIGPYRPGDVDALIRQYRDARARQQVKRGAQVLLVDEEVVHE